MELYQKYCLVQEEQSFDQRNGILLRDDLNGLFDQFLFTIYYSENGEQSRYHLTVSELNDEGNLLKFGRKIN